MKQVKTLLSNYHTLTDEHLDAIKAVRKAVAHLSDLDRRFVWRVVLDVLRRDGGIEQAPSARPVGRPRKREKLREDDRGGKKA